MIIMKTINLLPISELKVLFALVILLAVQIPQVQSEYFPDDFSTTTLDSAWSFTDPRANSQYSLTTNPGHLQINVPASSSHDCWTGLSNCARMLRAASNDNAVYETKIDGQSISI